MPVRPSRLRALAPVALLAALVVPGPAAPAAAQDTPPADAVVPAVLPATPPRLDAVAASASAVAFLTEADLVGGGEATTIRTSDGRDLRVVGRPLGTRPLVGDLLLLSERDRTVTVLDTRTGARRRLPTTDDRAPVLLPDGSWAQVERTSGGDELVRYAPDDTVTSRQPLGTEPTGVLVADAEHAVFRSSPDVEASYDTAVTHWRSVARDGSVRLLGASRGPVTGPVLTQGAVAWADRTGLYRARLSDGAVTRRPVQGDGVAQIALTPTAIAWIETEGIAVRLLISPEGASDVRVRPSLPLQTTMRVLSATDEQVVVAGGATSATRGVYALAPDGNSRLLVAAGGAAPYATSLRLGAVLTTELAGVVGEGRARAVERTVARQADGSTGLGPPRVLLKDVGTDLVGGPGLVVGSQGYGVTDAVVADASAPDPAGPVLLRRLRPEHGGLVAVSGPLAVQQHSGSSTQRSSMTLSDLRWGGGDVTLPGYGHLQGELLARVLDDGSVVLRDLRAGTDTQLRAPGGHPAPGGLGTPATVVVAEGWVGWRVGRERAVVPVADPSAVRRLPDGARDAALAGGRAAWADEVTNEVHLLDLTDGTDEVLGRQADLRVQPAGTTVLAPDAVAWTQDDGSTRVRSLPQRDGDVRVLGTWVPRRASPATGFVVRVALDRPVPSATLTVTERSGAPVAVVAGASAGGGLRLVWDLTRTGGGRVPDGPYRWRLDGAGQEPLEGEVVVDSVVPELVATIAPLASDNSPGPGQRLTWRSNDTTARFSLFGEQRQQVFVAQGQQAPGGPDAPFVWQPRIGRYVADAPSGGVSYGPGAAQPAWAPGNTTRYTLEVRDEAGNSRRTTAVQLTPYDDRWRSLRYSSGWVRGTATGNWLGTHTEATTPGRTVTVRSVTNRVAVVGTRCAACGRFDLRVDGTLLRTVDTRGASTVARQRLVDLDLGGIPKARTITVTTLSTPGRPRVRLDAVALLR